MLSRISDGVYQDGNVTIKLRSHTLPLAGLENVETAREQLEEHRQTLQRWQGILAAIEQRESIQRTVEGQTRGARWEEGTGRRRDSGGIGQTHLPLRGAPESQAWRASLACGIEGRHQDNRDRQRAHRSAWRLQSKTAEKAEENAKGAIRKAEDEFNQVMGSFGECIFPEFAAKARTVEDIPDDFDAAIALFLRQQSKQASLADETARQLAEVERWFGDEFRGDDEQETIRLLREELEALADKEEALARDWNAHIHGLKATFDRVLRELGEVQSAKDDLNRQFAKVQVSNLKSVRMEVLEQTDL